MSCKSQTNDELFSSVSYAFAQQEELKSLYVEALTTRSPLLAKKEILLLEKLKHDRSLHQNEITQTGRILKILSSLHLNCGQLLDLLARTFVKSETAVFVGAQRLSASFAVNYGAIVDTVADLQERFLFTLRAELRCHAFYYLDLAFREGLYVLPSPTQRPDFYITKLATDLVRFHADIRDSLVPEKCSFVVDGVEQVLEDLVITNLRYVRAINLNGVSKVLSGIATLEQALACMSPSPRLSSARLYYEMLLRADLPYTIEVFDGQGDLFTLMQWQCLLDTLSTLDISLEGEARKEVENAKVRLKYLIEEQRSIRK